MATQSNSELHEQPSVIKPLPPILDVACGGRMFWFDKSNPLALYLDKRQMEPTPMKNGRTLAVTPDAIMDFRNLDLPNNHFSLVVFDPPHVFNASMKSVIGMSYGSLNRETWQDDLQKGFAECFRVLKPAGVLVFKWNEFNIPLKEILDLTPYKPLFGHKSGKAQLTHWLCFMKPGTEVTDLQPSDSKPSEGDSKAHNSSRPTNKRTGDT